MSVEWPPGFERTSPSDRQEYPHGFRVDLQSAFENIATQLRRMDVDDWRVTSGTDHRSDKPHLPYASAPDEPEDPAVVARWTVDGEQFAAACDRWSTIRDNAQAVGKYLDAKRALERYGVATVDAEFATARLPSGDDDATAASAPPHDVLNVSRDADPDVVKAAARSLKKKHHPDAGGDRETFQRIVEAEEVMLDG
jgi:hypothetical protein